MSSRPDDLLPAGKTPGAYLLLFRLPEIKGLGVGRLGTFDLPAGCYAYVGSAMGGLEARASRHLRGTGKKHWHIDYLMDRASDKRAYLLPSDTDIECDLAEMVKGLRGAREPMRGFGSSDCRCGAHLFFLDRCAVSELRSALRDWGARLVRSPRRPRRERRQATVL